jgi:hypothetical protein
MGMLVTIDLCLLLWRRPERTNFLNICCADSAWQLTVRFGALDMVEVAE